jgi:hypothetical protein
MWPVCWDYASCVEEHPSGGELVRQNMTSQYEETHQIRMMINCKCNICWPEYEN